MISLLPSLILSNEPHRGLARHLPNILLDFDVNIASNSGRHRHPHVSPVTKHNTVDGLIETDAGLRDMWDVACMSLARIALKLMRTESAVAQQWRKQ